MRSIVWRKQFSTKEALLIKLTLDLWESYYYYSSSTINSSKPNHSLSQTQISCFNSGSISNTVDRESEKCFKQNYKEFIDSAIEIYGLFSDADVREIYMSNFKYNFRCSVCFQSREDSIFYYKNLKRKFVEVNEGLKNSLFVV